MGVFSGLVARKRVIVGDGGMGTGLMASGLPSGQPPEVWNLDRPDAVESIHRRFVEAGSDVIVTNTFGGNRLSLGRHAIDSSVRDINRAAVDLARRVVGSATVCVAGTIGPTGELLKPYGSATESLISEVFLEQAEALEEAGVDFFVIETMTSLAEAMLAVKAAHSTGLEVVSSMTFRQTSRGCFTLMGEGPIDCAKELMTCGAAAVGCNCGTGIDSVVAVLEDLSRGIAIPLAAWPNAGIPSFVDDALVYDQGPEDFVSFGRMAIRLGVVFIGGCCGSGPEHVRSLRRVVDEELG